ncbi:hypothetical protein SYNTR_0924 [Candidatus Syntrophocurvum alkaliphilum]|uniref:Uncharacterized protein n=1 Tax=Candidatus Syntrophocurvum alkaliphilum TaxID=2293317 RepID=A0A6I6DEC1_9FIRM|nr:virulence-related protein [Candidatus Syntrophocurvum alkaliphilum]QGT99517.1 hypothetical protein SYNTR_0924 [Candidatus Syntrophocurvum alkaliphilum]
MDRKQIVKRMEDHFKVKAKYLYLPTYAYEITTDDETYTISKEGKIVTAAGLEMKLEEVLNKAVTEPFEETIETTALKTLAVDETKENLGFKIDISLEGHSGRTLRNLINMIYSKQDLIKKSIGLIDNIVEDDLVADINIAKAETIQEFKLDIKPLETNIEIDDESITFNLPQTPKDEGVAIQLFNLIDAKSKNQKHVVFNAKPTDNEKYTFRTWLLRLGMIGDEYKEARKVLLKNLSGNAAFRQGGK